MPCRLVPDVPHDAVVGRIEHIVQCYCEFHDSQTAGEVSRVVGHLLDDVLPELLAHLRQRLYGQRSEVSGKVYLFEQFLWLCFHDYFLFLLCKGTTKSA